MLRLPLISGLMLALGACSGSSGGGNPAPPDLSADPPISTGRPAEGVQLRFDVQPSSGLGALRIHPAVRVSIVDPTGGVIPVDQVVRLGLVDPKGCRIEGAVAKAVGGVAEFPELRIFGGGEDLQLEARSGSGLVAEPGRSALFDRVVGPFRRHVIVMIADGCGYKQIEATRSYLGRPLSFESMNSVAMSTFDFNTVLAHGKGYDTQRAWSEFSYLAAIATDSAAAATAMFCGELTFAGMLGVVRIGNRRLLSISELAQGNGLASGTVSSVAINHATPAGWAAHNESRHNYQAIGDEMLFGDPAVTGDGLGSRGPTPERCQVLLGAGSPLAGSFYLSMAQRGAASRDPYWQILEVDGGAVHVRDRLLAAAQNPARPGLLGVFGGPGGQLPYALHDGSGRDPAQPSLADLSRAALQRLQREPKGFALMIEGGSIDWACHEGNMSRMLGEMIDFEAAVQEVIDWVDDPRNGSSWSNTLLIVTGDHETGLLSAGPGVFPDQPLAAVTDARVRAEQLALNTGLRASWEDADSNGEIDAGETVHWAWNSNQHSNSLVPCFLRGADADTLRQLASGEDPKRGRFMGNTGVYALALEVFRRL